MNDVRLLRVLLFKTQTKQIRYALSSMMSLILRIWLEHRKRANYFL